MVLVSCSTTPSTVDTPTKAISIVPTPTTEVIVYQDFTNKFELTYSKEDFRIDSHKYPNVVGDFLLNLEKIFPGKNLEEVKVSIAVNPECQFIGGYSLTATIENALINGTNFKKYSARDSGSGTNVFETITYQTTHNDNCYEIHTGIREYRLDVFPNLSEYSRSLLDTKVDGLIETFRFIE